MEIAFLLCRMDHSYINSTVLLLWQQFRRLLGVPLLLDRVKLDLHDLVEHTHGVLSPDLSSVANNTVKAKGIQTKRHKRVKSALAA